MDPIIKPTNEERKGDVVTPAADKGWFYADAVKEHFFRPKNFLEGDEVEYKDAAMGMVGSPACGDAMKVWISVKKDNEGNERILRGGRASQDLCKEWRRAARARACDSRIR